MHFATFGRAFVPGDIALTRRLVDRFAAASAVCSSLEALRDLLVEGSRELGFSHVALLQHASLADPSSGHFRIDNYPLEWAHEFIHRGLTRHDPVHLASRHSSTGFEWSKLGSWMRLGPSQLAILERSRYFGIGHGFTIPFHVPGEPGGSCSFAVRPGVELPQTRLCCAELVGLRAFDAARRLSGYPRRGPKRHLSRREVQCLRLIAAGKTDWEISKILGISLETARQYVKRARTAYDAVTRAQLVALGLRDDWLSFDDALGAWKTDTE